MFQSGMDALTPEHIAPAAMFLGSDLCADRTGHVLAVAGQQMHIFKVVQSTGKFKDGRIPGARRRSRITGSRSSRFDGDWRGERGWRT